MKILLIQTAFPGDVILATALVADLAERFPTAELQVLVRKGCEDILADNPHVSEVYSWDKGQQRYRSLLSLGLQLRRQEYDRVYNLQRYASSGWLSWRTGAAFRCGFSSNPFSFSYHRRVAHRIPHPHESGFLHEVQRNHLLLDDHVQPVRRPEIYPSSDDRETARLVAGEEPFIVLAPASNWFTKQWPEESWAELIPRIPVELRILLVGGKADYALGNRLSKNRANIVNACGLLGFRASAALMDRAWHVFSNDSAPLHLASAVNAPTTAIFCSTLPQLGFGPLADDREVIRAPLPCCSNGLHGANSCKAGHFQCARSIAANDVLGDKINGWQDALSLRKGKVVIREGSSASVRLASLRQPDAIRHLLTRTGSEVAEGIVLFHSLEQLMEYVPQLPLSVRRVLEAPGRGPVQILLPEGSLLHAALQLSGVGWRKELALSIPMQPQFRTLLRCTSSPLLAFIDGTPELADRPPWDGENELRTVLRYTPDALELVQAGNRLAQLRPWVSTHAKRP